MDINEVFYIKENVQKSYQNSPNLPYNKAFISGVVTRRVGGQLPPPSDNFLRAVKSKGGAKIRNCQNEILYKVCEFRLVNKFNDNSDN